MTADGGGSVVEVQCQECTSLQKQLGVTEEEMTMKKERHMSLLGKGLLTVFGASCVGLCAVTAPFLAPALRRVCLPYIPATTQQLHNVLRLIPRPPGGTITSGTTHAANMTNTLIDLGSGDGRIVIEAARQGLHAEGVELNRWLVWYACLRAWREGVANRTSFRKADLWKTDLSRYDTVVIFGVEQMMGQLESKLSVELSPDGRVIACRFPLPNSKPVQTVGSGIDTVWLYTKESLR